MDTTQLLQIEPPQLTFVFELKKQSSCLLHLVNKASHFVAFKVKMTSPKKYCVRPNIGIIKPEGTCDITFTMQAQHTAPPDMNCKDKFLIQSTVVPFGTTQDDISSDLFSRENCKYVEDKKLKVVLIISPPESGSGFLSWPIKACVPSGVENVPSLPTVLDEGKGLRTAQLMEEDDRTDEDHHVSKSVENESEMKQVEDEMMNLDKELKSMLTLLDSKPREALLSDHLHRSISFRFLDFV